MEVKAPHELPKLTEERKKELEVAVASINEKLDNYHTDNDEIILRVHNSDVWMVPYLMTLYEEAGWGEVCFKRIFYPSNSHCLFFRTKQYCEKRNAKAQAKRRWNMFCSCAGLITIVVFVIIIIYNAPWYSIIPQ